MADAQARQLRFFDYLAVARAIGLSAQDLAAIERGTRAEYGNDDMLFELRMLRTCNAILSGRTTVHQVLAELRDNDASAA